MARILIVASYGKSLTKFRGDLIDSWLANGNKVFAVAPDSEAEEELKKKGVFFIKVSLKRDSINVFQDLLFLIKIVFFYWKIEPDYIFLYTIKPVIYGSIAAMFSLRSKVYSLISGLGFVFVNKKENKWFFKLIVFLYRLALSRNVKVFFQNRDDRDLFIRLKIIKITKTVIINGSGVNLNYYKSADLIISKPVFLMIARFVREKGFYEYAEAAKCLNKKYPQARFQMIAWLLSEGYSSIDIKRLAAWKEEGIIEIFSYAEDVRPFIAASTVYVLPSYREGTPRTVLEAMSMGRAIITTDAPGCRETVVDGLNGFLVPVKDSVALAKAMERFIVEPQLIEIMGAESRKIAEEKYDVHQVNAVINRAMGLV